MTEESRLWSLPPEILIHILETREQQYTHELNTVKAKLEKCRNYVIFCYVCDNEVTSKDFNYNDDEMIRCCECHRLVCRNCYQFISIRICKKCVETERLLKIRV